MLPDTDLPHLGLRQLTRRVIAIPAQVLRTPDHRLALVLPAAHPYARRLVPAARWQLPLPFDHLELALCDVHF